MILINPKFCPEVIPAIVHLEKVSEKLMEIGDFPRHVDESNKPNQLP